MFAEPVSSLQKQDIGMKNKTVTILRHETLLYGHNEAKTTFCHYHPWIYTEKSCYQKPKQLNIINRISAVTMR